MIWVVDEDGDHDTPATKIDTVWEFLIAGATTMTVSSIAALALCLSTM